MAAGEFTTKLAVEHDVQASLASLVQESQEPSHAEHYVGVGYANGSI